MSLPIEIAEVLSGARQWAVVCADNAEILPLLPDKSVQHVITDPPYDEKTHAGALAGTVAGTEARGIQFAPLADPGVLAGELLRISARWVLAFCALEQLAAYRDGAGPAWVRSGVWDKIAPSPQLSGDRPAQAVEAIAIMHRAGRKSWSGGGAAAIWRHLAPRGDERPDHPTPKPLPLMLELVELFSDPGEIVLDPFAGSGTTGVACLRLGRRCILIEKDARYAEIARERLTAEGQGQSLKSFRDGQIPMFGADRG